MKTWLIYLLIELLICYYLFQSSPNNYVTSAYRVWIFTIIAPVTVHYKTKFRFAKEDSVTYYLTAFRKLINGRKNELTLNQLHALYAVLGFILLSSFWLLIVYFFE